MARAESFQSVKRWPALAGGRPTAHEILARRLAEERPADPTEYAASVHHQAQALRYRAHDKLMRAFLDDEVFSGHVRLQAEPQRKRRQASLLD